MVANPEALVSPGGRTQRPDIGDVGKYQRGVTVGQADFEHARHLELPQLRRRHATRRDGRGEQSQRIAAGESELLKQRMRYTPAQGNLHAKTGTTNGVISLGGYVTARDGELLAFAFIYNGTDRWNAKSTIDAMGATLAGFAR